jgi:hypothetical protein
MSSDLSNATPDSFAAFRELLSVLSNARKSTKLLSSIERRLADVQKGEQQLVADREAYARKVASDREEIEAQRKTLRAKEVDLRDREGRLAADQEILERQKATLRKRSQEPFMAGSGLAREQA